jgi:hypothetical protein
MTRPLALALLFSVAACRTPAAVAGGPPVTRVVIPDARGVSDLALVGDRLWAVPERVREVLLLDLEGHVKQRLPLEGVPTGLDTESMTVLADGRLAFGTESQEGGRDADLVLFAERRDGRVVVTSRLVMPYALLGFSPAGNQGIEGLCRAGDLLVAGIERKGGPEPRQAPVAIYDLTTARWTAATFPLTTATGKVSALACAGPPTDGHVALLALERHYGVSRVLAAEVPTAGGAGTSRIVLDLAPLLDPLPNLEGLVVTRDALYLVNDNDNGGFVRGETELLRVRRP